MYCSLIVLLCSLATLRGLSINQDPPKLNFIGIRTYNGKHEVRVAQNGILGMEVTIPGKGEKDLFLRLVSDGNQVVKVIYSDKQTIEFCEIEKNNEQEVDLFLQRFTNKQSLHKYDLILDNIEKHLRNGGNYTSHVIHPHSRLAPQYRQIIELHYLKKVCHESRQNKKRDIKVFNKNKGGEHHRGKRELIYPGTKWCGKGNTSLHYDDLGESRDEDKCCRTHDHCGYMIEGMKTKWGYFNPRLTTISHCDCDDRFITCLKTLNSQVADMIGELFFNVAKTQCFKFTRARKCSRRKWWGKCAEWSYELAVKIEEPFPYEH